MSVIRRLLGKAIRQLGDIDKRLTVLHTKNVDHQFVGVKVITFGSYQHF